MEIPTSMFLMQDKLTQNTRTEIEFMVMDKMNSKLYMLINYFILTALGN